MSSTPWVGWEGVSRGTQGVDDGIAIGGREDGPPWVGPLGSRGSEETAEIGEFFVKRFGAISSRGEVGGSG